MMCETLPEYEGANLGGANNPYTDDSLENDWVGTKEYWEFVMEVFNDECGPELTQAEQAACFFVGDLFGGAPYIRGSSEDVMLARFKRGNKWLMGRLKTTAIARKRGDD